MTRVPGWVGVLAAGFVGLLIGLLALCVLGGRDAPEWQAKFDSYYQRWLQYRATNNRDEVVSMERRMRDIMVNYRIPPNTPFDQVASPGIGSGYGYYRR